MSDRYRKRGKTHKLFAPRDDWREHHGTNGRPKLRWGSEEAAQAHASSLGARFKPYVCGRCGAWHVGMLRPNQVSWMAWQIIEELELGTRVAACIRAEDVSTRNAIRQRFAAVKRHLRRRLPEGQGAAE